MFNQEVEIILTVLLIQDINMSQQLRREIKKKKKNLTNSILNEVVQREKYISDKKSPIVICTPLCLQQQWKYLTVRYDLKQLISCSSICSCVKTNQKLKKDGIDKMSCKSVSPEIFSASKSCFYRLNSFFVRSDSLHPQKIPDYFNSQIKSQISILVCVLVYVCVCVFVCCVRVCDER